MLEMTSFEKTNEILRKHLIWDGETHICERFNKNNKIKQCFNCWVYDYIKIQCHFFKKCDICGEPEHKEVCQVFKTKVKCSNCEEGHHVQSKLCAHRQKEIEKLKAVRAVTPFYFPERPCSKFSISQSIASTLIFSNVERKKIIFVARNIVINEITNTSLQTTSQIIRTTGLTINFEERNISSNTTTF